MGPAGRMDDNEIISPTPLWFWLPSLVCSICRHCLNNSKYMGAFFFFNKTSHLFIQYLLDPSVFHSGAGNIKVNKINRMSFF